MSKLFIKRPFCRMQNKNVGFDAERIWSLNRVSHLWETANSAYSDNIRCLFYVVPYAESTRQTKFAVVRIRVSESCRRTPACGKRQFDERGLLRLQSKTKKVAFLSFRTDLQPFFNFLRPELYKRPELYNKT